MPRLSKEDLLRSKLRILVYGPTGSGKTFLCGHALDVPELRPILIADVDGGVDTVTEKIIEYWEEVEVHALHTPADVKVMLDALYKPSRFKTVILDGLTEYHAMMLATTMAQNGRSPSEMPALQDYGGASAYMLAFLRNVRKNAIVHFLTTAGQAVQLDEASGTLHVSPDIVGKLSYRAPRFFHIVGHITTVMAASKDGAVLQEKRRLQVQPFGSVRAKDRSGKLGAVLLEPTMQKIYDLVYSSGTMLDANPKSRIPQIPVSNLEDPEQAY